MSIPITAASYTAAMKLEATFVDKEVSVNKANTDSRGNEKDADNEEDRLPPPKRKVVLKVHACVRTMFHPSLLMYSSRRKGRSSQRRREEQQKSSQHGRQRELRYSVYISIHIYYVYTQ